MYVKERFRLPVEFRHLLNDRPPKFGYNGFGELIFYTRYSRFWSKDALEREYWDAFIPQGCDQHQESWADCVVRVINGTMSIRKDWYVRANIRWDEDRWQQVARAMAVSMYDMKWLPPGRGLWAMGTPFIYERGSMCLYNCFSGSTRFVTDEGIVSLQDAAGKTVKVLTDNGVFRRAEVRSFGSQELQVIRFKPCTGTDYVIVHRATKDHRWLLADGTQTTSLKKDDVVRVSPKDLGGCPGSRDGYINGQNLKGLPDERHSWEYKRGYFEGWLNHSGYPVGNYTVLDVQEFAAKTWALEHAPLFGYVPVECSAQSSLFRLTFNRGPVYFAVESSYCRSNNKEEVFCVVEPVTGTFTLAGGIVTGNCAYTEITDDVAGDVGWLMDSLMLGVGVGFSPLRNDKFELKKPRGDFVYVIPDTREGWVQATELLINAYVEGDKMPILIYDQIRSAGLPIKGFGGFASGPAPLIDLHDQIRGFCERFRERKYYDSVHLKADIVNCTGCCVVAGNVRRSAELLMAPITDQTFLDLKDYDKHPDRAAYGWMSNNTAKLTDDEDFDRLGQIAERVPVRGEPGIANMRNFSRGRIGKKKKYCRPDRATGLNPCGEITLEHREVCNVAETLPTMCEIPDEWKDSCEYATIYMSTVSLLPTHQHSTNQVVARNRRIGCSIIDVSGWKHVHGVHKVTKWLREGYKRIKKSNQRLNGEAGIPEALKITTIKPGGTTPKLAGKTPGIGHPTFEHTLRRIRIAIDTPVDKLLLESGLSNELCMASKNTRIYEYPILQGPAKPANKVSLWEQAMNLVWMQREWSDNAVSNTLYFKPKWELMVADINRYDLEELLDDVEVNDLFSCHQKETIFEEKKVIADWASSIFSVYYFNADHEECDIEPVLSSIAPLVKSVSLLPHSVKGAYAQMPEEGISAEEYNRRVLALRPIQWHKLSESDGIDERYCNSTSCEK